MERSFNFLRHPLGVAMLAVVTALPAIAADEEVRDLFWYMMTEILEKEGVIQKIDQPRTEYYDPAGAGSSDVIQSGSLLAGASFNVTSDGWEESWNAYRKNGAYYLSGPPASAYHVWRDYPTTRNVIVVDVTAVSDHNPGYGFGVNIRRSNSEEKYYSFRITSTGNYVIYRFDGEQYAEVYYQKLAEGQKHPAIRTGIGATNRIELRTWDSMFDFYVNGSPIVRIYDTIYPAGGIGFRVSARQLIAFDNFALYDAFLQTNTNGFTF